MRKSTAHALSILTAVLFLLPFSASAAIIYSQQSDTGSSISLGHLPTVQVGTLVVPSSIFISSNAYVSVLMKSTAIGAAGPVTFTAGGFNFSGDLPPVDGAYHTVILTLSGSAGPLAPGSYTIIGDNYSIFNTTSVLSNVTQDSFYGFIFSDVTTPIDFGSIYYPLAGISTSTLLTASSSGLWSSIQFASSTVRCVSGNIFSDGFCSAISYLFVPNPDVLNLYAGLIATTSPTSISQKFPFSWGYAFQNVVTGLSAGTSSMMTIDLNLNGKMASSSDAALGNSMLPNITLLSKATIVGPYISQSLWDTLQGLIAAMLWLGLFWDIYHYLRHRIHRV